MRANWAICAVFIGFSAATLAVEAEWPATLRLECSPLFEVWNQRVIDAYAALGITVECVELPLARSAQVVAGGQLDGSVFRAKPFGDQFPGLIRVEPPVTTMMIVLYRRKGEPIDLSNWRQHSIVSLRGSVLSDQLLAGLDVYRAGSVKAGLKQLSAGRVDLMLGDTLAVPAAIVDLGMDNVEPIMPPVASYAMYHFLSQEHQQLVAPVSRQLLEMAPP